jgi:AcrR family transcriptional regulator
MTCAPVPRTRGSRRSVRLPSWSRKGSRGMSDPRATAIVDGAREAALDFGTNRLTMTDIARRANVSRQTIYRQYPDVRTILSEVMAREFEQVIDRAATTVDGPHGRARIVARITATAVALRANPLLQKVLDAEPEVLLPYHFDRLGAMQRHALDLIRDDVARGQRDGSVRDGNPRAIAYGLLLVTQAFVLTRAKVSGVSTRELLEELPRVVDGALRPERPAR